MSRYVSGFSFQAPRTGSGTSSKRPDLAMVAVRSSRSLIGAGSLTINGGTLSAAAWRSLLVLVWLRIRNSLTLTRISRSGRSPSRKLNGGPEPWTIAAQTTTAVATTDSATRRARWRARRLCFAAAEGRDRSWALGTLGRRLLMLMEASQPGVVGARARGAPR